MRNKKIECVWRRNRILSVSKNTPYICKYNSKRNDKISNKNNWIKKNYKHDAKKLIITILMTFAQSMMIRQDEKDDRRGGKGKLTIHDISVLGEKHSRVT